MTTTTHLPPLDPDWRERAACQGMSLDLFYGPDSGRETPEEKVVREARAKAACHGCPVRADCLEERLRRRDRYGIHGGLNEDEYASALRRWQRRAAAA